MDEEEIEKGNIKNYNENKINSENTLSIGIDFGTKKTISAIWNKKKKREEIIKDPKTKKTKFTSIINIT
jgi:molecular chaperone DnaK (HSP70)